MTRRALLAIVGVAAAAVVVFGVPLAMYAARLDHAEAILQLERDATRAVTAVPSDFATSNDPVELPRPRSATRLGLYDVVGRLVVGDGPARSDRLVRQAQAGRVARGTVADELVVAVPVTADERRQGIVRAALPMVAVRGDTLLTWGAIAALALLAIAASALLAAWQARRLSDPMLALTDAARRLGAGDFATPAPRTGIVEIDRAAAALDDTASRLELALRRERSFSADVAHQLATPLTRLRLLLEQARPATKHDPALTTTVDRALEQADVLEGTIDDLLTLARDARRPDTVTDLAPLLADVEDRWHGTLAAEGRPLRVVVPSGMPPVRASAAAVRQILDVLVHNAAVHGDGEARVVARPGDRAVAVDVSDDGTGITDPDDAFARRSPSANGTGIGLALARSLAEAEGGRLVLAATGPFPTLTLLVPVARLDAALEDSGAP